LQIHLNIKIPFLIFAGSWGTTLALLYAEAYPHNVSGMILRGVFTCSYDEQDYFYSADGAARFSPRAWYNLINKIPPGKDRIQERIHKLIESSDEEGKLKWCRTLAEYEYSFFNLPEDELEKELKNIGSVFTEMRINMYYQANRFFIENEQIIKNVDSIKHIPAVIIQGDRDLICPPVSAWRLHTHLVNSKLILVPGAGHLSSEPGIQQALLAAVNEW
jgi:proline iminopeptidase